MPTRADNRHEHRIAQIQNELTQLQASVRVVMNAEELMALEHEIHEITNRLAAALLEQKVQASLDSDGMTEAEKAMIEQHPKRLRSEGKKTSRRTHIVRM